MAIALPPLPFGVTDLEPHISAETVSFHYGKHHRSYVDQLNEAIDGTDLSAKALEDIIAATAGDRARTGIFNKAAQAWNHDFFWHCVTPDGDSAPSGVLADKIDKVFGGLEGFKEAFGQAAAARFGSGWVWLVIEDGDLKVTSTCNAGTPMVQGQTALLTCDVWEHAYYLDYQNRKAAFVEVFLDKLVNWSFVSDNLSKAR